MPKSYDSQSYASAYSPEKSIYQDDGRMFHRGGFDYETVQSVDDAAMADGMLGLTVTLSSGAPAQITITPLSPTLLRFQMRRGDEQFDQTSEMLENLPNAPMRARLTTSGTEISLAFGERTLIITRKPFGMRVMRGEQQVFTLDAEYLAGKHVCPPLGFRTRAGVSEPYLSWRLENDSRYFGLGEKFGKVERTTTRSTIWASDTCGSNTTDMSYKAVPVLYCTRGWGIMVHTSYRTFWEIGTFSYTAGSTLTQDPRLDAFFFFGDSLKDLVGEYTGLTGRPRMPPKWAMGLWMSRCQYMNRGEVDPVLKRLRAEKIPCDVIHLDPLWMQTHWYFKIGVDACDFLDNDAGFPDQPAMFKAFMEQGFNTDLWINPYLPEGGTTYAQAAQKGYILKSLKGGYARLEHGNPVGMIDFTNPEACEWWKDHLRRKIREGASVFKPDYGDRVPEDALFHNGRTGREMHNLYLHHFSKAAYEVAEEMRGEGIVWRRAGYIGSQRYPGTWAGDTQVSWEGMRGALRGGLSAGLTGEPFWSHDMGGFTGPMPTPELYIRWAQWGMLSPLSRFHGAKPREPWEFSEEAVAVVKHYAKLRYALMPYLLACARHACDSGVAILRHMALEFPTEPNVDTLDDQYMLGDSLLIAPILLPGVRSRPVYLPQGTWFELERDSGPIEGGRFVTASAALNRVPVFVRGGSIIPRYIHNPQHLKGGLPSSIGLDIYPGTGTRTVRWTDEGVAMSATMSSSARGQSLAIAACPFSVRITLKRVRARKPQGAVAGSYKSGKAGTMFLVDAAKGVKLKVG